MRIFTVRTVLFFILSFFTLSIFASNDPVLSLPGLKKIIGKEYAGYTKAGKHNQLFYWFVATQKPGAPIIVWSNGGPGYSSLYGFFDETGPYKITSHHTLKNRKHAWTNFANYLVIDQPAGVGMSAIKGNTLPLSREQGTEQYFNALKSFLKNHPAYQHSPIYLAGESYAGTYLPLLAAQILLHNKNSPFQINLKGLILMSPWIDPAIQQSMDTTYAYQHGLITHAQKLKIDLVYQHCLMLIEKDNGKNADTICGNVDGDIEKIAHLHMANIAYTHLTSNCLLDHYLHNEAVLKAIHASLSKHFACWSNSVNKKYYDKIQSSVKFLYNQLLSQHIRIIIFSGLNDAKDTNFLGMDKLIHSFEWQHKNAYFLGKTIYIPNVGYLKSGGGLAWVKVLNAGHMIPQDQPKVADIVKNYVENN